MNAFSKDVIWIKAYQAQNNLFLQVPAGGGPITASGAQLDDSTIFCAYGNAELIFLRSAPDVFLGRDGRTGRLWTVDAASALPFQLDRDAAPRTTGEPDTTLTGAMVEQGGYFDGQHWRYLGAFYDYQIDVRWAMPFTPSDIFTVHILGTA
jgi:hypothetical protein